MTSADVFSRRGNDDALVVLFLCLSRMAFPGRAVTVIALMCLLTRRAITPVTAGIVTMALLPALDLSHLIPVLVSDRIAPIWEYVG